MREEAARLHAARVAEAVAIEKRRAEDEAAAEKARQEAAAAKAVADAADIITSFTCCAICGCCGLQRAGPQRGNVTLGA